MLKSRLLAPKMVIKIVSQPPGSIPPQKSSYCRRKAIALRPFLSFALLILAFNLLLLTNSALALVSEGRPGVPYFDQVFFLQNKLIEDGEVVAASLAFADPKDNEDLCLNRIDVFNGLEKFRDIPEKKWVLVDFELQSLLIAEGFAGDADVHWVKGCPDVDTCLEWAEERKNDPHEIERRSKIPRPKKVVKGNLEDISKRLELGRKLVKAARCRGCHDLEGFGSKHAPSLTWKRVKYESGWLGEYLNAPYRMRPTMNDLMMLKYTSPNAKPSLQETELGVVADYLAQVGITSAPDKNQRRELWETYDCYACHAKLYKAQPLNFTPTPIPEEVDELLKSKTMTLCLGCHTFGDKRTVEQIPAGTANAFAPDLLLAFEKLDLNFISSYLEDPTYMVPASQMPKLGLDDSQVLEMRNIAEKIKGMIDTGIIEPIHVYYELEKETHQ